MQVKRYYTTLPDSTGQMLLMQTVRARRCPRLEAPCITSSLSLKSFGRRVLQMRTTPKKIAPMKMDVDTATITANFVSLGLFAPSSLDTLTLERPRHFYLSIK